MGKEISCGFHCIKAKNIGVTIGQDEILNLVIAPTTGCNFACPYCFEGEKEDKKMTLEVIKDLIVFINSFQKSKKLQITWYGGEPLTAFDIMTEINSRIKKECKVPITSQSLITNGYLIDDKLITFMKSNQFKDMQITFDGAEESHNKTRCLKGNKQPTFDRIMSKMDMVIAEMPLDFSLSVRINVNKDNEMDFITMYKLLKAKYPLKKNLHVYPGFIREPNKDNSMMCYKSLFGKKRYEFYKRIKEYGLIVDFYPKRVPKGCMTCQNESLVIGPMGEIYKCWNDFNHSDKIVGYIKDKRITNPSLISQYTYETTIFSDPKCKECKIFPICDGGCIWYRYQNVIEGKNYNLCTFLSDNSILEECLLAEVVGKDKKAVKAR